MTVDGAPAAKAARQVAPGDAVHVSGPPEKYVGRGGRKLDAALAEFGVEVRDRRCLDAGSSTGGFTDCLLQAGAASVLAVDVGTHQLHERIRNHPRVTSLEQTDIRAVELDEPVDVVVADLSFISTISLFPVLGRLLADDGDMIVLIKPQFEAGRADVSRGRGIITSPDVWARVLHDCIDASIDAGLLVVDLAISPITGGKGNVEFLCHQRHLSVAASDILDPVVDSDGPNGHSG